MTEIDGVPPLDVILQSLRRLNADVQIHHASSKRKDNQPSPLESMREFNSSGQYHESSSPYQSRQHHRFVSPSSRSEVHHHVTTRRTYSSSSSMNEFDHLEQSIQSVGREMQSTEEKMRDILSTLRALNGKRDGAPSSRSHRHRSKSPSPKYEVPHREHVHHQEISEASVLASSVFQKSEIKLREIIEPAPIVQDPVNKFDSPPAPNIQNPVNRFDSSHTKQGISEMNTSFTAKNSVVDEMPVREIEEFKEVVAHQVFEETPQSLPTVDDEDEGAKSQETEATSKDFPESTPKLNQQFLEINEVNIQVNKFGIKFFDDDMKLEISLGVMKNGQDYSVVSPVIETEELSYVVEVDCKLDIDSVTLIAAYFFQVIRPNGVVKDRIGVG